MYEGAQYNNTDANQMSRAFPTSRLASLRRLQCQLPMKFTLPVHTINALGTSWNADWRVSRPPLYKIYSFATSRVVSRLFYWHDKLVPLTALLVVVKAHLAGAGHPGRLQYEENSIPSILSDLSDGPILNFSSCSLQVVAIL